MSKEEGHLLLSKWHEEQTPLYVVLSVGNPATSLRLNMPGLIAELDPTLVIGHAHGPGGGQVKCSWSDIEAFEYLEMRGEADKLAGYPGAQNFMWNRSILLLRVKQDLTLRLVDLALAT